MLFKMTDWALQNDANVHDATTVHLGKSMSDEADNNETLAGNLDEADYSKYLSGSITFGLVRKQPDNSWQNIGTVEFDGTDETDPADNVLNTINVVVLSDGGSPTDHIIAYKVLEPEESFEIGGDGTGQILVITETRSPDGSRNADLEVV